MDIPCCLVRTGGLLFEYFLTSNASYKSHKIWKKISSQAQDDNDFELDPVVEQDIIKAEQSAFHGCVLMGCNSIGNLGKQQMFYSTFVSHFHGLSRMGCEILAKYGFCMRRTMYDKMRGEAVSKARAKTRSD